MVSQVRYPSDELLREMVGGLSFSNLTIDDPDLDFGSNMKRRFTRGACRKANKWNQLESHIFD